MKKYIFILFIFIKISESYALSFNLTYDKYKGYIFNPCYNYSKFDIKKNFISENAYDNVNNGEVLIRQYNKTQQDELNKFTNPLFILAQKGLVDQLQRHLLQHKENSHDLTRALHMSIDGKAPVPVIEMLVKAGADVNGALNDVDVYGGDPSQDMADVEKMGLTPLGRAGSQVHLLEALLKNGADPNETTFEGGTLLLKEIGNGLPTEKLRLLLRYGANPNWVIGYPTCPRDPHGNGAAIIEGVPCTAL